jgi:hypothetical protein
VEVQIDQSRVTTGRHGARHRSDPDRAVAAEHERELAFTNRGLDPRGDGHNALHHRVGVHRPWLFVVHAPAELPGVTAITKLAPDITERIGQACGSQRGRPILLARSESPGARGCPDQ